jgi:manganese-dependent inorganic pyrophosphatase
MVTWLNDFAKLDIDDLADNMFKAKSDISDIPTDELLGKDYKQYDMNGKKIGFGVWETVAPKVVMARNDEIITSLKKRKSEEGLDYIFFGVVDILGNNSNMYLISDKEKDAAISAFNGKEKDSLMYLQGIVSRKMQMIPPLEKYFASL